MKIFEKWQGCGNDFVIIDSRDDNKIDSVEKISKICDRHFGVGADGVIYVLNSEKATVRMRIFNADGSEAEMCGNGIRCFTKYLLNGSDKTSLDVETGAGVLNVNLRDELVTVDMGEPILDAEKIPVIGYGNQRVVNQPLGEFNITCVSMGNPHCVIFVDDIRKINLAEVGAKIERHKNFPKHTNVEFVELIGENTFRMRVWERGSGITLACGTGACASAVAANLNGLAGKSSKVILDGGTLNIAWHDDNHICMTGAAEKVFTGSF